MWTGLIRWRILIDCLGVKTLRYEGDWWEYCRYEKVTEMRLAVTGVLAVRIKCRLGGLSSSETGMVSCLIRPKAAFFCW